MGISHAVSTEVLTLPYSSRTRMGHEFSPGEDMWIIPDMSRTRYFNFKALEPYCSDALIHSLKKTALWYLREKSTAHANNMFCQFKYLVEDVANGSQLHEITGSHILSYKGNLPKDNLWYLGSLSGFLKKWYELGYSGVKSDAYAVLENSRISKNKTGEAVLTFDPLVGPLDEIELHAIHEAVNTAYAEGVIGNREFSLVWLFMATGARSVQIAGLKVKDLTTRQETGQTTFFINIPRAKQRQVLLRKSFKTRPLIPEVGKVIGTWANQVKTIYASDNNNGLNSDELPLFPVWNSYNPPGLEHHPEAVALNKELQAVFSKLEVKSHRTGERMQITSKRFRYTLGTRAAMEKNGELVIAELLDHSDTQHVKVYVKCVPEIIEHLDKALAMELAPFADAFAGKIVTDDSAALRSDDPASLVRYPKLDPKEGGVGRCGGCGECNGMVPIACYVCRNFQAWLDAPHEEVLQDLLYERQRLLDETGDERIAFANDNIILAVSQVVQKCSEIKGAAHG